jgi:hypothetical protein
MGNPEEFGIEKKTVVITAQPQPQTQPWINDTFGCFSDMKTCKWGQI